VTSVVSHGADPVDRRHNELVIRWEVEPGPDLKGFRVYREVVLTAAPEGGASASGPESADPEKTPQPGPGAVLVTPTIIKGPGPHSWTESPLPKSGVYRYWIEALGTGTNHLYLDPIEVEVDPWADVMLALYPNPVVDQMKVAFSMAEAGPVQATIYGIDGRMLYREDLGTKTVGSLEWSWDTRLADGQHVAAGTYFLVLRTGTVVYRDRFVVMRRK
ncbi:MAG: T9SS type A sorting domain-containing protein, partial [Candidatus Eisenbacteria bacterium]|nr:T9SS type A sorting domain-containing protein [Candidatus Eisenbacteria bacterium]